jgi:hypothetical protein
MLVVCSEAKVGEWGYIHEDGFDLGLSEVTFPRIAMLVLGQLAEWCGCCVVLDDVARGDDIFESIAFGDLSAFLAFASDDEDGLVFVDHFSHWRVSADELCWCYFDVELAGQVDAAFCFCLPSTVGEEDVRTTED